MIAIYIIVKLAIKIQVKEIKKVQNFRISFRKTAIMYGKDKFSRIKDSICNTPVEVDSVYKALLRAADRNGLLVKLE